MTDLRIFRSTVAVASIVVAGSLAHLSFNGQSGDIRVAKDSDENTTAPPAETGLT